VDKLYNNIKIMSGLFKNSHKYTLENEEEGMMIIIMMEEEKQQHCELISPHLQ
jgi:hypothetical protein